MSKTVIVSKFQLASAYLGTTVLGLYVSSPYHSLSTKALFLALPPAALFLSRIRRTTHADILAFIEDSPALAFESLDFDIISRAS
jgi:hypothetical protein